MNQIQKETNLEDFKCPSHINYNINTCLIQKQVENNLVCFKCLQEKNISLSETFHILEIVKSTDESIITNFPPFEDSNIHLFLNNLKNEEDKIHTTIDNINQFFDEFKTKFLNAIQQIQSEIKLKASTLYDLKQQIQNTYNEFLQSNLYRSSQLKQILEDKFVNVKVNTEKMKEKIDIFNKQNGMLCLEGPQKIQEHVLYMIEKITLFEKVDILKMADDHLTHQNLDNEKQKNVNKLLDLIKNPTNYCSKEFLNEIEQYFNKYQNIFDQIEIKEDSYDTKKKNIFTNLPQQELEDISDKTKQIMSIKQTHQNKNEDQSKISNQIQFDLKFILYYLSEKYAVNIKKFENLLIKNPIFDQLSKYKKNQISEIYFEKSQSFCNSKNQQIDRLDNNHIQIQKSIQNGHAVSYANFILNPELKYVFRIKILSNEQENTAISIGLIEEFYKDTVQIQNNGLSYIENGSFNGITKVIKGKNVFEGKEKNINKEIELRVHLESRLVQVLDYPNYQNISELFDKYKLDLREKYRVGTSLYYQEHQLIITCFAIVDEFDTTM